jgi:hypothetical protein
MVYDEGFDINFENRSESYFAFSKYGPRGANSKFNSKWVSYCYATLIGWYRTVNAEWGCFKGEKIGYSVNEETNGEASNKQMVVEGWTGTSTKSFLQKKDIEESRFMETDSRLKITSEFTDHAAVVNIINESNLSWTAKVYSQFEGMSIKEMNRKLYGKRKARMRSFYTNGAFIENKNTRQVPTNLPPSVDYTQYMNAPRNQGACGSCYAMAALNSVEARFRIKYANQLKQYYPDIKVYTNNLEF